MPTRPAVMGRSLGGAAEGEGKGKRLNTENREGHREHGGINDNSNGENSNTKGTLLSPKSTPARQAERKDEGTES